MDAEKTVCLSTRGMTVRTWETIKDQYAQAGYVYDPDVVVFVHQDDPPEEDAGE